MKIQKAALCGVAILCLHSNVLQAQDFSVYAEGLQWPLRASMTAQGNLLVSEGGVAEANTGRLSIVDRSGGRRTLIEGLPSGPAHFVNPYGPASTISDGDTIYHAMGEGDVYAGSPPNVVVNPNGQSSPIFNSILKMKFSANVDSVRGSFKLSGADHWGLADGYDVELQNTLNEKVTISLMTAYRPLVRNVLGGTSATRQADPFGMAYDSRSKLLFVTDAGSESVYRVDTTSGKSQVLHRFVPFARGAAIVDNVPTGVCYTGEEVMVGNLTAAPFPVDEAVLRAIDPRSGVVRTVLPGLSRILDLACSKTESGSDRVYVLEAPGNVSRIRVVEGGTSRLMAENLPNATGMVVAANGDVFLVEFAEQGRILRVAGK